MTTHKVRIDALQVLEEQFPKGDPARGRALLLYAFGHLSTMALTADKKVMQKTIRDLRKQLSKYQKYDRTHFT